MSTTREFDLVLMGATGFTGRLVAEHLLQRYPAGSELTWAMAGRSESKLETVRSELGEAASSIPLLVADSHDVPALESMVGRTVAVISTVGPYARYGSELVAACAAAGTHYCDLTGEVQWVRRMIDAHETAARDSGARIVHCCGFDSIPSDLGVWALQQAAVEQLGAPLDRITLGVRRMRGGASGGTIASMFQALEEGREDPSIRRLMADPYALDPADTPRGPKVPDQTGPRYDEDLERWTAPFVMAQVNTRVVRRSNAVLGFPWGEQFRYHETSITGRGFGARVRATATTAGLGAFMVGAALTPTRALLQRFVLPSPGEGPSAEARQNGCFDMLLVGSNAEGKLRLAVTGDRDPGYGATSRMIGEAGAALALDGEKLSVGGGSWTPASCFGGVLVERLIEHAGMTFDLV